MNTHLKTAVQHLDCYIAELTEVRKSLLGFLTGEPPAGVTPAAPVQTLERPEAGSKVKSPRAKVGKRKGGGAARAN